VGSEMCIRDRYYKKQLPDYEAIKKELVGLLNEIFN
jgi:hypothetical protein